MARTEFMFIDSNNQVHSVSQKQLLAALGIEAESLLEINIDVFDDQDHRMNLRASTIPEQDLFTAEVFEQKAPAGPILSRADCAMTPDGTVKNEPAMCAEAKKPSIFARIANRFRKI